MPLAPSSPSTIVNVSSLPSLSVNITVVIPFSLLTDPIETDIPSSPSVPIYDFVIAELLSL